MRRRSTPPARSRRPAERRLAIIRLHSEGWTPTDIAEYLRTSRKTVHATLRRWIDEGVAGITQPISPHKLRHFLLTWLKKQGIDDALFQPSTGHASRQSLEIYSRLAIGEAQAEYEQVIARFPV